MARKKRGGHGEEHGADESWLLPYSDMMTLLLALFIVLFAASNIDKEKYQDIMEAFADNIGVIGDRQGSLPGGANYIYVPVPMEPDQPPLEPDQPPEEEPGGTPDLDPRLQSLYNSINLYIVENDLEENMGLRVEDEGININLTSDAFFASGSAEVTPIMRQLASVLAGLLVINHDLYPTLRVTITGHTDNRPINTEQFPNNWYLGQMRATNFLMELLKNQNLYLDQSIFKTSSHGETSPIATNDTEGGRQANRRVEVWITLAPEIAPKPPAPTGAEDMP